MAKRNGKRRAWTSEHVRTLKALARKRTPAGKIARSLKRTEGATRQKAFSAPQRLRQLGDIRRNPPRLVVSFEFSGNN
jgi:hypothetical protein